MSERNGLPTVLIPGLAASPVLYAQQIPELWRFGPVMIADHTRAETIADLARRILAAAPPQFALVGLSMGGYVAFELLRQQPDRVLKLALLDTSARSDTQEASGRRHEDIQLAQAGRYAEVIERTWPRLVHRDHIGDENLKRLTVNMMLAVGPEAFVRQQRVILGRPDSRAELKNIRCPTTIIVGDDDRITPIEVASEMAAEIRGARLITVANSGHLSAMEQPAAVTAALVSWLA